MKYIRDKNGVWVEIPDDIPRDFAGMTAEQKAVAQTEE